MLLLNIKCFKQIIVKTQIYINIFIIFQTIIQFKKWFLDFSVYCCGDTAYSFLHQQCCNGVTYNRDPAMPDNMECCDRVRYRPDEQICCHDSTLVPFTRDSRCCGVSPYNYYKQFCRGVYIYNYWAAQIVASTEAISPGEEVYIPITIIANNSRTNLTLTQIRIIWIVMFIVTMFIWYPRKPAFITYSKCMVIYYSMLFISESKFNKEIERLYFKYYSYIMYIWSIILH